MENKENIQKAFNNFNNKITLGGSKRDNLIRGRNGLRSRIKNKFTEKDRLQPKFYMQGSFAMKTTVNPIGDKEYDVDDGVYIQGYSDKDISEWPSTTTVHTWVKDAVQGYTSANPIDKKVEGSGNSYTVTYIGPEDPNIIIKILFTSDSAGSMEYVESYDEVCKFNIIKK